MVFGGVSGCEDGFCCVKGGGEGMRGRVVRWGGDGVVVNGVFEGARRVGLAGWMLCGCFLVGEDGGEGVGERRWRWGRGRTGWLGCGKGKLADTCCLRRHFSKEGREGVGGGWEDGRDSGGGGNMEGSGRG